MSPKKPPTISYKTVGELVESLKQLDPSMDVRCVYSPTMDDMEFMIFVSDYKRDGIDDPEELIISVG